MVKVSEKKNKIESPSALFMEYDWFKKLYPPALAKAVDNFFKPGLRCELIGVSKNINLLQDKECYFVTKVRIDKFYEMYLRISGGAISLLLNKGLGRLGRPFDINKITRLEQAVLTAFNDYVFKVTSQFLDPPPTVNFVRTNFDMTHLTFVIKDEEENVSGRFIISVPDGRLSPKKIETSVDKFEFEDFYVCPTQVRLEIGKTRFTVKELKELEVGDLIVFEESNIQKIKLDILHENMTVLVRPNMEIELPFNENDGGLDMSKKPVVKNLWDSIEVDMYAELDPVKISLGDLKKIELGQVIDVAALYENKISLRVENKIIGHGELVIVNDRYGVKVLDIEEKSKQPVQPVFQNAELTDSEEGGTNIEDYEEEQVSEEHNTGSEGEHGEGGGDEEEEFDYSDFELEDEDI